MARQCKRPGHAVVTSIEHPSVIEALRRLEHQAGWRLTIVDPCTSGEVDAQSLVNALEPETCFVSMMLANNETGVLQPVRETAKVVKRAAPHVIFHTDATQAIGKIPVRLDQDYEDVDAVSWSAHKFHGPKGCGGLILRKGLRLEPLLLGGGQEHGKRSGTLNVPAIVGCGTAALQAFTCESSSHQVQLIRDRFEERLLEHFPAAIVFGVEGRRLPNTSCFAMPNTHASSVADRLATFGVYVGTGSAFSSGAIEPPRTLLAMHVPHELASSALRVSFSRYSHAEDVEHLFRALKLILP